MADGLSAAASIVGIVAAAVQSIQILSATIDAIKDAPDTIRNVKLDLQAVGSVLRSLEEICRNDNIRIVLDAEVKFAVENCSKVCTAFQNHLRRWVRHSGDGEASTIDRWRVALFGQERIRTLRGQLNDCKSTLTVALSTATTITMIRQESLIREMKSMMLNENQELKEQADKCRSVLLLTDPYVDREKLISIKGKRVTATCEWLCETETYQSWLYDSPRLLWISGGPGKGKTMLSIYLTEELERRTRNFGEPDLIFFFCSHQDENRNTAVSIVRGLVCQIIEKRPMLAKHVLPYLETRETEQKTLKSFEGLWIIFRKLVQDPELGSIFCVLDGLDECDDDTFRKLLSRLVDIFSGEDIQQVVQTFRLVIISRDLPALHGSTQLKLDPDNDEQVDTDIGRYISSRVNYLSRIEGFNAKRSRLIQKRLLERAEGTFLWVGFVMNELSHKKTMVEVEDALQDFPIGLYAIYQIEESRRSKISRILQWVTLAGRPLTLKEIAAAVDIKSSDLVPAEQAVRDHIALCGLFHKIEEQEVRLVHQSAREYLLRNELDNDIVLEEFRIKPEETHFEIARICLDCLSHSPFESAPMDLNNELSLLDFPLVKYATMHWPDHARKSSAFAGELVHLSGSLLEKDSKIRDNWWKTYYEGTWDSPKALPQLHMACYLGIEPWVQSILPKKGWFSRIYSSVDSKDNDDRTPLPWAARNGHEGVVSLLIQHGAYPDTQDRLGWTPLSWAVWNGHMAVVKLLLDTGRVDVDMKDPQGWTPLAWATDNGHEAVVKLLLATGKVDVDSRDKQGRTPLSWTAEHGHKGVVQLLIQYGADINSSDQDGLTPIAFAAQYGNGAIVSLLIEHGASLDFSADTASMSLAWAAEYGNEELASSLIQRSARIDAKDERGWTPLTLAAQYRHEKLASMLIRRGASVHLPGPDGATPLLQAAQRGHGELASLLVQHGAYVNSMDQEGHTTLVWAAYYNDESLASLLIQRGANLNPTDQGGWTPLAWAAYYGSEAVARVLLETGKFDVNIKDQDGRTVLWWATEHKHKALADLLRLYNAT
ncbi:MAG: hypothetical protein M1820_008451 [Bogoriella megaspora]|nr:MAG: hypothetical protein M1820_008451 [Bogoriella megaspora]